MISSSPNVRKSLRTLLSLGVALQVLAPAALSPAYAASVSSASFSGGAGTATVGTTLYAKNGGALTLAVTTSSDTKCVEVSGGGLTTTRQTSSAPKANWSFNFTAGAGDGPQTATVAASSNFNANGCTAASGSTTASYTLDNTAPVLAAGLSPAPNAAGWNNSNVSITWNATDAGSGLASGPTPATDSVTANSASATRIATATDKLGNSGPGSVTVKLDKAAPIITGSRSPAANTNGWNNTDVTVSFACSDSGPSGMKTCSGPTTLSGSGDNQSVSGTAVDNADNTASASVDKINIDKVAPSLSGAPTQSPNAAGWYSADVTVHWTASDALSGLAGAAPADSTISGEGTGLTASAAVSDKAGNTTSATSSPAVKIDKTAPITTATAPTNWNNTDVTVSLTASDALSGVASTFYKLDGGAQQSGTSVPIAAEGIHALDFWSVDNAGNAEATRSVQVKIDKTPPTINHTQAPAANGNGWNNTDVTVSFVCSDALAGLANCTAPQTITTEGQGQKVSGTATDNAGNTATDPATVSIDKTAPTISAAADRAANTSGWYGADVTVSFTCGDGLSGVASCPAPQTLGEGATQSASGSATDAAGNSASASVSGINVDKTAPSLSGAATTAANANGWYNADVTIHWTASDALSGLDGTPPADSTIAGEGDNLSASTSVSDKAANTASASLSGIKIDRTPPSVEAKADRPANGNGWYNADVTVSFTCADNLSGVASCPAARALGEGANQSAVGEATDAAGNTASATLNGINVDKTAPSLTLPANIGPLAATSADGTLVNYTVSASDNFDAAPVVSCNPATGATFAAGATTTVTCTATDQAGNQASGSFTVTINPWDTTPPTIIGTRSPQPNANGWNNSAVTVSFACTDAESGVASCAAPQTLKIEGKDQSVTGTATDNAGNTASTTVDGINIDKTAPSVMVTGVAAGSKYEVSAAMPTPGCETTDGLSQVQTAATVGVTGKAAPSGVGSFTAKCSGATDQAGNTAPDVTATYSVIYSAAQGGPLAPINADGTSRFKLGSTIPVKVQLMNGTTPITNAVAKLGVTQTDTAPDAGVDEAISTAAATTGNLFRYDATSQQYIFNLSTRSGYTGPDGKTVSFTPGTWTLWVLLDDGTSRSVKVQLVK